jgi:hypothetical protein
MAKCTMKSEEAKRRGRRAYRAGVPLEARKERRLDDLFSWREGK